MPRKNIVLDSGTLKMLEKVGTQIKKARLRRNMRAALELDNDLELIALDEAGKKQFSEQNLQRRKRATRKKVEKQ